MDGTLSPNVDDPEEARVTSQNKHLLSQLQRYLPVLAIISGRAACDVQEQVGFEEIIYVRNHGLEQCKKGQLVPHADLSLYRSSLKAARDSLQPHLVSGTLLEDKGATLSIHYRRVANPEQEEKRLSSKIQQISDKYGLRITHGRIVFELRPSIKVDKGSALQQIVNDQSLKAAIYLGDDTTDVAAMQMCRKLRKDGICDAWGIGVISPGTPDKLKSYADFLVEGVSDVEELLDWLLMSRKASST